MNKQTRNNTVNLAIITDEQRRELFEPLGSKIREFQYDQIGVFTMLSEVIVDNPALAAAFATHLAVLLQELEEATPDYTELVYSLYYDVLFDPKFAHRYGTNYICSSRDLMSQFVAHQVALLEEEAEVEEDIQTAAHSVKH